MKTKKLTKRQLEKELLKTERATKLESLLRNPESTGEVPYALQTVLVELANESQVHVDHLDIAPVFYRVAVDKLQQDQENGIEGFYSLRAALRHLNALIDNPTVKNAKLIVKYWDGRGTRKRVDPFPEK